jgi:hypothetical protein
MKGLFKMATKTLSVKPDGPSSNDAASAASYRYEARVRELHARFENEIQAVRDAYLQESAGLDLTE